MRQQVFRLEQTSLGCLGKNRRKKKNKFVTGYSDLGLGGDATLDNMDLKFIYVKIAPNVMGMESIY